MKKLIFLTVTLFIANFSFGQWGGQFKFLTEEFYSSILSFGGVYGFDVNLESFEL
ncbi:MAG: hypothetical protein OXE55_07430 [Flavobacteriaceae bacterium]|nr:hypothetical protein [Flavobacteriaceae bacterium]